MSPTARLVAAALRDSPAASLLARWEATQRAAAVIAAACRSISGFDPETPGACELRGEVLWLCCPTPSHSAKLRQAVPRLLSELAANGMAVYEVKTRVHTLDTTYPGDGTVTPSSDSRPEMAWPESGVQAIDAVTALAGAIDESPLRQAAAKLAATLRKRAGRPAAN